MVVGVIAGAVLAAGSGTRMGRPKGTLVVDGMRLVDRAVAALRDGGCTPVIAVVRDGVDVPGAIAVVNPDPDQGLRSSLELAIDAATDVDATALAVVLADMPGVGAAAVHAVADAWRPGRISLGHYQDGAGHPIVMSPAMWRAAVAVAGPDEGARQFLATHGDLVDEVAAVGDLTDIDFLADLGR